MMTLERRRRIRGTGLRPAVWIAMLAAVAGLRAQGEAPAGRGTEASPIDVTAEQLNYDRTTGWIIARGNVVITRGDVTLTCNYGRVNVKTETAHCYGDVVLKEGTSVWRGESIDYDFNKEVGTAAGFAGQTDPFRVIRNEKVEKTGPNTFVLHDAVVTTCTNEFEDCHYHVKARQAAIRVDESITLRGCTWYLGGVPVMYLPFWKKDLRDEYGWELKAGHGSRMGAYLLTAYRYPITSVVKGRTHLDYRTRRGVAVGQDLGWEHLTRGTGDLALYYADDQEPIDEDEDAATADIDSERFRARLRHYVGLSTHDYIMTRVNVLSDTDILEDFFEDEYRLNPVPENYSSYVHRGDWYTANLLARVQVNDFFGGVNRIPEASVESFRQQLGLSRYYYQGRTALGYLERVFPDSSSESEYSSFRFDTAHTLYRPSRHFGFLNIVPRAGARGTYYSDTRTTETVTEAVTVTQTNTATDTVTTGTQTNTTTVNVDSGSGFRQQFELGMETSFKAFRIWDGGGLVEPRRHVVEPYANYTYLSEPNLLPGELYQFDSIDALNKQNFVKLGVRNKLQVKRRGWPFDVLDVDVYTRLRFETEEDEEALDGFFMDAEIRPNDWVRIDLDGEYDTGDNRLYEFNTRLRFAPGEFWRAAVEHRYRDEVSSVLNGSLTLLPNEKWNFNLYGRYELEDGRVEEQGGYLQRNFDCMAWRLRGRVLPAYTRPDGSEHDTDVRVNIEFWLTDFPGFGVFRRNRG